MFSIIVAEPTKHCKDGEFQCGNSDQCIPESKVCDAHSDCNNKMDEPMSCGELNVFFYCVCICGEMEGIVHDKYHVQLLKNYES